MCSTSLRGCGCAGCRRRRTGCTAGGCWRSALRLALPPLVYICVRPRLVRGGWGNGVILAAVAALALSNGLLATLSMMRFGLGLGLGLG